MIETPPQAAQMVDARTLRKHSLLLFGAAILCGLLVAGALIYRSDKAASARAAQARVSQLVCRRLHILDTNVEKLVAGNSTRAALLKFIYYREHPGEIRFAQAEAAKTVRAFKAADCQQSTLARIVGTG